MKRKEVLYYLTIILLAVFSSSCMEDSEYGREPLSENGLKIKLATYGISSRNTENGVDELNENKLGQVVLMIFDENGNRTPQGYRVLDFSATSEVIIATGNWKNNTELFSSGPDASYDLYFLANIHESTDLSEVATLEDLKNMVDKDVNIWKYEKAKIENDNYNGKSFAMSGAIEGFVPKNNEDNCTVNVEMKRLAAKVEVTIKLEDDFKQKFAPTGFYCALRNYATKGLWLEEKEEQFNDRGLAGNGTNEPMADAYEFDESSKEAKLLLYTYPNDWSNDVLSETFVLLNMPGNYNDGNNEQSNKHLSSNYYKIPIRLGVTDEHRINRNTIYRVDVTIDRLGQLKPDEPVELSPGYEVVPWENVIIDVDDTPINFLELQKEEIIMKNIATSNEQFFTSSSNVTAVINEVYYYDKYGQKQNIDDYSSYGISASLEDNLSGRITVSSEIPTNNGIRYIIVNVSNGTITKSFKVKQYPLEYIVTVPGWYSYREDFGNTYEKFVQGGITSNNLFSSKVYIEKDNLIYPYSWNSGDGPELDKPLPSRRNNNNMYFVRITKTSGTYVISVPAIDSDGYTDMSPKNNQLVSPAFMISSILGGANSMTFDEAKEHCKQYGEKSIEKNDYKDWRLPTEAELLIIYKFQNTEGSVIDKILAANTNFWAASGKIMKSSGETGEIMEGGGSNYIRCIRTVKPDEPIVDENE